MRDHNGAGRNYNAQAYTLAQKVIRLMFQKIIAKILVGDRVFLTPKKVMYIGMIPDNPARIAKWRNKNRLNLHTNGRRYGVKITGFAHNCYIRMPSNKRMDLMRRIKTGQKYLN